MRICAFCLYCTNDVVTPDEKSVANGFLSGLTPRSRGAGFIGLALAALLLSGCASQVVSANARSVVVDAGRPPNRNSAEAQRMADAECAKFKRIAQMTGRPVYGESNEYVFACVD